MTEHGDGGPAFPLQIDPSVDKAMKAADEFMRMALMGDHRLTEPCG